MRPKSSTFSPFNRLNYPQKFTLISLIFILPLLAFYPLFAEQVRRAQEYGTYELYGTYYLRPLQSLLSSVQEHQYITAQVSLQAADSSALEPVEERINQSLQVLGENNILYADELLLTNEYTDLSTQLNTLIQNYEQLTDDEKQETYAQITAAIQALIRYVGDTSFLILDPELDTYYLMDAVLLKLPENQSLLSEIRERTFLSINNASTLRDQIFIPILTNQLREQLLTLELGMETSKSSDRNGHIQALITGPFREYTEAANDLIVTIEDSEFYSLPPATILLRLNELTTRAQTAQDEFYKAASEALEIGIEERAGRYFGNAYVPAGIGIVSVVLGFLIGSAIMRRISHPLNELARAANRIAEGDLTVQVDISTEDEIGQVGQAFNRMGQELQASQTRLAETLEVSRRLSRILEPDQLVLEVVEQISNAFNFYHTHIYLLDDDKKELRMVAGTGDVGNILVERGHTLSIDRGLVGRAARTRQPVLVKDTKRDPDWVPNPLLPETAAEIAVPIQIGDQVLGVLDVQQNIVNGLTEVDVDLLQSIANQTAIAVQNANTLQTSRENEETLRQSQELFQTILETSPVPLLISSATDGKVLYANKQLGELLRLSVEELIGRQTPDFYYDPADRPVLLGKVRAEGSVQDYELHVKKSDGTPFWVSASLQPIMYLHSPALLAAFYDLTERKNAEETLAKRAERDRVLNRISSKLRGAVSMEQVLQIAVQEVRQSVGASRAVVQILADDSAHQN